MLQVQESVIRTWTLRQFKSTDISIRDVQKLRVFSEIFNIPYGFFETLEAYVRRNSEINRVCTRCFKAFLIKTAINELMPNNVLFFFSKYLACERGHSGYFLDEKELYNISCSN